MKNKELIAAIIREHFDCGTLMPTKEDEVVADQILALLKQKGCCCEYMGQCDNDPQITDYCPMFPEDKE